MNHELAIATADRLASIDGVSVLNDGFFNEFTLRLPGPAAPIVDRLAEEPILAGVPVSRLYRDRPELAPLLLVAVTETTTEDDIERLATALEREVAP